MVDFVGNRIKFRNKIDLINLILFYDKQKFLKNMPSIIKIN